MESVSGYFSANPAAFTLLAIFIVLTILYSIIQKMAKLAIGILFVVLLFGGIYLFKDPGSVPDKVRQSVETFKNGSDAIGEKFSNLWSDTKDLAGKAKKMPGDINKMLDTAKDDVGK